MIPLAESLMCIAYILLLFSVLPNVYEVWKNRGKLKGFSLHGVTITGIGVFIVQTALYVDSAFLPVLVGIPNMFYWIFLNYSLWKQHFDK